MKRIEDDSIKITENYLKKILRKVAPLVEEISELKYDYKKLEIKFDKECILMDYIPVLRRIRLNPNLEIEVYMENTFNSVISHEVMHDFQEYNFPDFKIRNALYNLEPYPKKNIIQRLKERNTKIKNLNPFERLAEADATFISSEIKEKYFKDRFKLDSAIEYLKLEKILRKKFSGNRKDINELYTAPIKELIKIFGR